MRERNDELCPNIRRKRPVSFVMNKNRARPTDSTRYSPLPKGGKVIIVDRIRGRVASPFWSPTSLPTRGAESSKSETTSRRPEVEVMVQTITGLESEEMNGGEQQQQHQSQEKVASNSELVNSEQFRRTIADLVQDEIRRLKRVPSQTKKEESLLLEFAGEVGVTGLSDSIKAKHWLVRCLWILIFLGGLGATSYFVYKVFDEYRREPTATKIMVVRHEMYRFPRIVLCFDTWLNTEKALAMGLTTESLEYALRYLIPFEEVATQEKPKKSKGRRPGIDDNFLSVYEAYNFTNLADFFKYIALDAVMDSEDPKEIGFTCSGCPYSRTLEKVIIDKTVCYRLSLNTVDGKFRQAYGLPEYELRVPDLSMGLLDERAYWKLYVNPLSRRLMSDTPYLSIYEQHAHSVRLISSEQTSVELSSHPCERGDNPTNDPSLAYTSLDCVIGCASWFYRLKHNCSVFNMDANHSKPLSQYCNTYYWDRWPLRTDVNMNRSQAVMDQCIDDCLPECSFTYYQTFIDSHYSNSLVKEAAAWEKVRNNTGGVKLRSAKIYFVQLDALAGGVLTFAEVSTYSFQTLVGNIGGTCGIWIGVSVMTLIQFLMFFIERSLAKGCITDEAKIEEKKRKKKEKKLAAEQSALV